MNTDFDEVIIGGGAAGIGAARRLAATHLSVLLLEAQSRLGGRAWTQEIAGLNLDLGCGWLHSAEKNSWVAIAQEAGVPLDRSRAAWGVQYRDLGFAPQEQAMARQTYDRWMHALAEVRNTTDRAADALDPRGEWNNYVQAIAGYISGATLERLSASDYLAYDEASTESNWRSVTGLGALVAGSFPERIALRLATPVESLELRPESVKIVTATGTVRARAAILGLSTAVLAGDALKLPRELEPWGEAARQLPLGRNEKLFLEIVGREPFEKETQVVGNPRSGCTGSYYIRPMDFPVIEGFLGGESAQVLEKEGVAAAFAFALEQLAALFGADIRGKLRPLAASNWGRSKYVGGAYSYALPGQTPAREALARPFDDRVFFSGEATRREEFSTVHGAFDSGMRAAEEAIRALA
jgi:monoamine oxidase